MYGYVHSMSKIRPSVTNPPLNLSEVKADITAWFNLAADITTTTTSLPLQGIFIDEVFSDANGFNSSGINLGSRVCVG